MDEFIKVVVSFLPIVAVVFVMYLFMIKPEKKRQQATFAMQNNLQKNDKVVTIGGMYGIVEDIKDDVVTILTAGGTRIKFEKAAIKRIVNE
jgi:preprotein translocase subunit YajC